MAPRSASMPLLARHARKCAICNHPNRKEIDDDFISWRSESSITLDHQLPSRSSVYRHAAAVGLLERRRRNLRGVAERILERVAEATPSAAAVLRALRIYSQITEDGQWIEPPKRSIVTHIHITRHSPADHSVVHDPVVAPVHDPIGAPSAAGRSSTTVEPRSASPGESPVAAGPSRHSETPVAQPASPPVEVSPEPVRKTRLQLDYLPRWAAGLSGAEVLIGTQNADPETVTLGESGA